MAAASNGSSYAGGAMYRCAWLVLAAAAWVAVAGPGPPDSFHFEHRVYNLSVAENSPPRTHAAQPADDDPLGIHLPHPEARVRFRIRHGDKEKFFKTEERCVGDFCFAWVRTRAGHADVLNRERRDEYRLQLRATATLPSGEQLAADTELRLSVTDVNDLSPLFYPTEYEATVPEDMPPHSSVAQVTAEDADLGLNGEIYYSFADKTDFFTIHPVTGVVSVTRTLSHLEHPVHELTVLARDRAGIMARGEDAPAARASLVLRIQPVNLHAPEIQAKHLTEVDSTAEGEVYAIVEATDRDEGEHGRIDTVEIVDGDPDGHFRVQQSSDPAQWLVIAHALRDPATSPSSYNLTIRAQDAGSPARSSYLALPVHASRVTHTTPVFSREVYEAAVSEAAPPGTPLVRLKVAERDARVYIEIVGGNEGGEFKVHADTGVLYTAVELDAEKRTRYTLTVAAVDRRGAPTQLAQSSAKVQVTVLDANDNNPIFDEPVVDIRLKENGPAGAVVTRLTARDADSGENAYISYSIVNLQPVPFEVEHFSGALRTTRVLDFESMRRSYVIRVRASDWGLPYRRQAEAEVHVTIVDVNDNRPQFERIDCVSYLPRTTPIGYEILTLSAIDFDAGDVVTYRIASGNEDGCLSLDTSTGVLSLACDLSAMAEVVRVNVTATDGSHFADTSSVTLHMAAGGGGAGPECRDTGAARRLAAVLAAAARAAETDADADPPPDHPPANLHAPEFLDFPVEVKVNESVALGTVLVKLKARDRDIGYDGHIQYGISGGDDDSAFRIDPDTGELQVIGYLDREREAEYYLNITAYDCGSPRKATSRMLPITVLDVNDNTPKFERPLLSFRVTENALNGTAVCRLLATDPDGGAWGRVSYSMEGAEEFCIDSSGVLSVCASLDRERRALYELTVWATDGGGRRGEARVRVQVDDVNDCAPQFSLSTYSARVREAELPGALLTALQATDADTGAGGRVHYSLPDQPEDALFAVDEFSGVLTATKTLDYEDRQVYGVTVRATDAGQPTLWTDAAVVVEVLDVDENAHAPVFPERVLVASVPENATRGSRVLTCGARDADPPGRDSRIAYYIRGGTGMGHFSVDDAGEVRTLAPLDRERTPHFWLTVCAEDHGLKPKHACVPVYIEVSGVNDVRPWFGSAETLATVVEGAPAGTSLASLVAVDNDVPSFMLTYRIVAGNPDGLFTIDEDTGEVVTTGRPLDRESMSSVALEVSAWDGELAGHTRLLVTLQDVNDHTPAFTQRYYQLRAPIGIIGDQHMPQDEARGSSEEQADASGESDVDDDDDGSGAFDSVEDPPQGLYLGSVLALDPDEGVNGSVWYSVRARGAARGGLRVGRRSGRLTAARALRAGGEWAAAVRACDGARPPRCSVARVSVRGVPAATRGSPPHLSPPPPLQAAELDAPGFLLAVLAATDPDDDPLYYDIVDGDPRGEFYVGREDGSLVLARRLLWERQPSYRLNVSVTDTLHTVYAIVEVNVVNDVSEGGVWFSSPLYEVEVTSGAAAGTALATLSASARPPPAAAAAPDTRLLYGILETREPSSLQHFRLDELTGVLEVLKPLDWEEAEIHELTVWARDSAPRASRALCRVVVRVRAAEEAAAWWPRRLLQLRVERGAGRGARLARLAAAARAPAALRYWLAGGGGQFSLDPATGELSLARALPPRPPLDYTLHARVDLLPPARLAHAPPTLPIHILVVEPDDSPPRFLSAVIECSVYEGMPAGTLVTALPLRSGTAARVAVRGGGGGGGGGGEGGALFRAAPAAPALITAAPLDYEDQQTYNVTVVATNMGGGSAEMTVVVHVLDRNEHAPQFTRALFRGRVSEAAAVGSLVAEHNGTEPLVLLATDRDGPAHQQRAFVVMSAEAAARFSVHPLTGAVEVRAPLDYEQTTQYDFMVKVVDMGTPRLSSSSVARVVIEVTDVNDVVPQFSASEYRASVLTPAVDGLPVTRLQATDPDTVPGTPLTYDIIEGDKSRAFQIDEQGSLTVKSAEALRGTEYALRVRASDGKLAGTARVRVCLRAPRPAGLAFAQRDYWASAVENTTRVTTVAVLSVLGAALNEPLRFSILNPHPAFQIGSSSGVVRTTGVPLDREIRDNYTLLVEAAGGEGGADEGECGDAGVGRVARASLHVALSDINDNCPVFVHTPYEAAVRSGDPPGTSLITVHAIDLDANDNGEVRYEMKRGHGELFRVDRATGVVSLRQTLDQAKDHYELVIAAFDGGTPACSTETRVAVRVWGGGAAPAWPAAAAAVTAREAAAPLRLAPPLAATSPLARQLLYTLREPHLHPQFELQFDTARDRGNNPCVLVVRSPLDYETATEHRMVIRATDGVSGAAADLALTVLVEDVNDCAPHFAADTVRATVSEAAAVGDVVATVAATDNDTGVYGEVVYSLEWALPRTEEGNSSSPPPFSIDSVGVVRVTSPLDAETAEHYHLLITAADRAPRPLTSHAHLFITVSDVNDMPPVWERGVWSVSAARSAARGAALAGLRARDPDAAPRPLVYALHDHSDPPVYHLDAADGVLTLLSPSDVVATTLNVSVSDGAHVSWSRVRVAPAAENAHAPHFPHAVHEVRVQENQPPTLLTTVVAFDEDEGEFGTVRYSIPSTALRETFSIDSATGAVHTRVALDREARADWTVPVQAADAGYRLAHTTVRVRVLDDNDHAPRFPLPAYRAAARPDSRHPILRAWATDDDDGDNANVTYELFDPDPNEKSYKHLFNIDPTTAVLTFAKNVTEHEGSCVSVWIRARDGGGRSSAVSARVAVLGAAGGPPAAAPPAQALSLREDAAPGTQLADLRPAPDVTVSLADEAHSQLFEIDERGRLMLIGTLDRETQALYHIGIIVSSGEGSLRDECASLSWTAVVTLRVLDVNDAAPVLLAAPYTLRIAADTPPHTPVLQVMAEDMDSGSNGEVRYSLVQEEGEDIASPPFSLDAHTGWLSTSGELGGSEWKIGVRVTDGGAPARSSVGEVVVSPRAAGPAAPAFSRALHRAAAREDAPPGSVLLRLEAAHTPAAKYYITAGDPSARLGLRDTGDLYVARSLDRETQDQYELTVLLVDGKFSAKTQVVVQVNDVNDNPPLCVQQRYTATISEDVSVGQEIFTVLVTDADLPENARNKLYLTGDDADHFTIHKESGIVTVARPLDREAREEYFLTAIAQDRERGAWRCSSALHLTLRDVNDNAPRFSAAQYDVALPEDAAPGTVVATPRAHDSDAGDNRMLHYTLLTDTDTFTMDADTGVVMLSAALDRETKPLHTLEIRVTDGGAPALSGVSVVLLTVTDVNDNPPAFEHRSYAAAVPETAAVGTELVTIRALSADTGVNADVYYSIVGGAEHGEFAVGKRSGVVSLARPLDYETASSYMLTLQALDGGQPPLSDLATLNVTVLDANDNAPVFAAAAYNARVPEDAPVGQRVAQLTADDADDGLNARITYSLTAGNNDGKFAIDPDTGYVSVAAPLDRESVDQYTLTVRARDRGVPAREAHARLSISVLDANDNPPEFSESVYAGVARAGRAAGAAVLRLAVTDADAAPHAAPFTYDLQLGDDAGAFRIDPDGTLRTAKTLDHRIKDFYKLQIRVFDNGTPPLFSDAWVSVRVVEQSRFPPVATPLELLVLSYRDGFPGGALAPVRALDRDAHDTLSFSLAASHQLFEIEADSGLLRAAPRLDPGDYLLNVTVSDGVFRSAAPVRVAVRLVSDDLLARAVLVRFRAVSDTDFVLSHRKGFLRAVSDAMQVGPERVVLLGANPAGGGELDVAVAVRGATADDLRRRLTDSLVALEERSRLVVEQLPRATCASCGRSSCRERLIPDGPAIRTVACDVFALVSPAWRLVGECAAPEPVPVATPVLLFDGSSYLSTSLEGGAVAGARPLADELDVSFRFRTRGPDGTLLYSAGPVDYMVLELREGRLVLELELGGGAARASAGPAADGRWHAARLERRGGWARLTLDGRAAPLHAPPPHASLDLLHNNLYIGAALVKHQHALGPVQATRGFVGCLSELTICGAALPTTVEAGESGEAAVELAGGAVLALVTRAGVATAVDCAALPPPTVCHNYPCLNGGTCHAADSVEGFSCECHSRFAGDRCQLDTDPCASQPCLHGGICEPTDSGNFVCVCGSGLTGARCERGRYCGAGAGAGGPVCLHGAACEEGARGPLCRCRGYSGPRCQYDINECAGEPCLNGATCLNEPGSFRCLCPPDKTGMNCGDPLYSDAVTVSGQAWSAWAALRAWAGGAGAAAAWAAGGAASAALLLGAILALVLCRRRPRPPRDPPSPQAAPLKISNLAPPPPRLLNNMDTLRSYGSAGDELEGIPPDYRRNLNLEPDRKPWSEQMHLHTFTDNKIYNDLKGMNKMVPLLSERGMMVGSGGEPHLAGGYHWDCSDWCGAAPPGLAEVGAASERRDSSDPAPSPVQQNHNLSATDTDYDFADGCLYPLHPDEYLPRADDGEAEEEGEGGRPPRLREPDAASLITMLEERHSLLGGGTGGSCSDVSTRLCEIEESDAEDSPPPPAGCRHTDV